MPDTPEAGLADRLLREHRRYSDDGLPNPPLNAPLPYGDPRSGTFNPPILNWRRVYAAARDAMLLAQEAAAAANEYIGDAVAASNVPIFSSRTAVAALEINEAIDSIRVNGWAASNDGGHGFYARAVSEPAHPGKIQDAADAWWELVYEPSRDARVFGFGIDSDSTAALGRVLSYATLLGGETRLPAGEFTIGPVNITSTTKPFRLTGAGRTQTILKRGGTPSGAAFLAFGDCTGVEITDLTVNAQRSVIGQGSHGIRLNRCPRARVQRVHITDWTSSGIIHVDADSFLTYYDDILIEDCTLDGLSAANNGILLSNTRDSEMRGCTVKDVGRTGSPCFALQMKDRNQRTRITRCTAINARAGIAMGSEDAPNIDCRAEDNTIAQCTQAIRVAYSSHCQIANTNIDMSSATDLSGTGALQRAVYMLNAGNCKATGLSIRGSDGTAHLIYIRESGGNVIEIDRWQNVPASTRLVHYDVNAEGNVVNVKSLGGGRPRFLMDMVLYSALAQANTTNQIDDINSERGEIVDGRIRIFDRGLSKFQIDVEGGAAVTDDLVEIQNGLDGQMIVLCTATDSRSVVVRHSPTRIVLKGGVDRTLNSRSAIMALVYNSSLGAWIEV